MEGDKAAENDKELTSTSSSATDLLLSTNKEEKSDSNDTVPTSSTDASTSVQLTHSASDDPISSTSSEMDPSKTKATGTDVVDRASSNFDTDAELLGMSIVSELTGKIEENVDDLVNDLETLLGESTDPFVLPIKSNDSSPAEKTEVTSGFQEELLMNLLETETENEVSSNTDSSENVAKTVATNDGSSTEPAKLEVEESEISEAGDEQPKKQDNVEAKDNVESESIEKLEAEVSEKESEDISQDLEAVAPNTLEQETKEEDNCDLDKEVGVVNELRTENTEAVEISTEVAENISSQVTSASEISKQDDEEHGNLNKEDELSHPTQTTEDNEVEQTLEQAADDSTVMEVDTDNMIITAEGDEHIEKHQEVEPSQPAQETAEADSVGISPGTSNVIHENDSVQVPVDVNKTGQIEELSQVMEEESKSESNIEGEPNPIDEENSVDQNVSEQSNEVDDTPRGTKNIFEQCGAPFEKESQCENLPEGKLPGIGDESQKIEGDKSPVEDDSEGKHLDTKRDCENEDLEHEKEISDKDESKDQEKGISDMDESTEHNLEHNDELPDKHESEDQDAEHDKEMLYKDESKEQDIEHDKEMSDKDEPKEQDIEHDKEMSDKDESKEQDIEHDKEMSDKDESKEQDIEHDKEMSDKDESKEQDIEQDKEMSDKDESKEQDIEQDKEMSDNDEYKEQDIEHDKEMSDKDESKEQDLEHDKEMSDKDESKEQDLEHDKEMSDKDESKEQDIEHDKEMPDKDESKEQDIEHDKETSDKDESKEQDIEHDKEMSDKDESKEQYPQHDKEMSDKDESKEQDLECDHETLDKDEHEKQDVEPEEELPDKNESKKQDVEEKTGPKEKSSRDKTENVAVEQNESSEQPAETIQSDSKLEEPGNESVATGEHLEEEDSPKEQLAEVPNIPSIPEHQLQSEEGDKKPESNEQAYSPKSEAMQTDATINLEDPKETENTSTTDVEKHSEIDDVPEEMEMETDEIPETTEGEDATKKRVPEINIRRKTVEQDLEKVVCLSEESSDSDTDAPVSSLPPPVEGFPQDEDANLINIAEAVGEVPQPDDTLEDILPDPEEIIPNVTTVDAGSNLETILAVASLQNEKVPEIRVERRLSEKEIREMEAIRMAVASITDSSQDTYDNYLVGSVVPIDDLPSELIEEQTCVLDEVKEVIEEVGSDQKMMVQEDSLERTKESGIEGTQEQAAADLVEKTDDSEELLEKTVETKEVDNQDERASDFIKESEDIGEVLEKKSENEEAITCEEMATDNMEESEKGEEVVDKNEKSVDAVNQEEVLPAKIEKSEDSEKLLGDIQENGGAVSYDKKESGVIEDTIVSGELPEQVEKSEEITEYSEETHETVEDCGDSAIQDEAMPEATGVSEDNAKELENIPESGKVVIQEAIPSEVSENTQDKADPEGKDPEIVEQSDDGNAPLSQQESVEAAVGNSGNEDLVADEVGSVKNENISSDNKELNKESKKSPENKHSVDQEPSENYVFSLGDEDEVEMQEASAKEKLHENASAPTELSVANEAASSSVKEEPSKEIVCDQPEDKVALELKEKETSITDAPESSEKVDCNTDIKVDIVNSTVPDANDNKGITENTNANMDTNPEVVAKGCSSVTDEEKEESNVVHEENSLNEVKVEVRKNNIKGTENAARENDTKGQSVVEEKQLRSRTRRGAKVSEPLCINVEESDKKEKPYSPKVIIKPLKVPDDEVSTTSETDGNKGSLKMTITKQSDKMHSILKVYNPDEEHEVLLTQEEPIPKLIIKPKMQQIEQQHSPKMTTRSSKAFSPTNTRCSSPRITIKPVTKPTESKSDSHSPLKITFKPVVKSEETTKKHSPKNPKEQEQKNHNPKITIKPIPKPAELEKEEIQSATAPKVTIKLLKRPHEGSEAEVEQERSSPKITIKPVVKPVEQDTDQAAPKIKIKPIKKHDDEDVGDREQDSPKISIKPVIKPAELEEEDDDVKERIVLKINKGNLPTPTKESKKREHPDDDKSEKVAIKLKFSTTGGHTHIVQEKEEINSNKRQRKDSGHNVTGKKDTEDSSHKRPLDEKLPEKNKRLRTSVSPSLDKSIEESNGEVRGIERKIASPVVISEDSRSQQSGDGVVTQESIAATADISKIAEMASSTTNIEAKSITIVSVATPTVTPTPRKRGRPRKTPLEIRVELKDPPVVAPPPQPTAPTVDPVAAAATPTLSGGRPKRSCRGQNVIAALGIKPRKPRGGGRGRGGKVNMGDRIPPVIEAIRHPVEPVQTVSMKPEKELKLTKAKLKLMQKAADEQAQKLKAEESKKKDKGELIPQKSAEDDKNVEASKLIPVTGQKGSPKVATKSYEPTLAKKKRGISPKKLEVTTRRQKAQPRKGGKALTEPEVPIPTVVLPIETSSKPVTESRISTDKKQSPKKRTSTESVAVVATTVGQDEVLVITTDDDSGGTKEELKEKPSSGSPVKRSGDILDAGTNGDEKRLKIDDSLKLEDSKASEEEKKIEEASGEEVESGEDSEKERKKAFIRQRKLEAIKKCRAKRMEKLARVAESKRKRLEQAAQQREARKATEKANAEKNRANKRYGRYGAPKPQVSLVDAPVHESEGTVKSNQDLFDPETEQLAITQPITIEDDDEKDGSTAPKYLENQLTPTKLEKPSTLEPMIVDSTEDTPVKERRSIGTEDVVMVDEETRMSADLRVSRDQTPAKQVVPAPDAMVEDSQGSVGTEGGKSRSLKTPKMEVFQDLESVSADQLAEYSWNGQGPFMLQEQVAQYLGIKSFKRKYPNIGRRAVDMQERDYLKENALATEAQCDLGLTAVNGQDILDIMYTDFQDKYEEYCRIQRERQTRELVNKQKAMNQFTLKPGFDKLDILEQAVQSAAAWNQQFNKERREQRKAHMDLQNLTVQYPKNKIKNPPTSRIGHYPVALVPGQFTDHYREFTPTELNNLPLNTMCYDEIKIPQVMESGGSDGSSNDSSDSDTESSSGSSSSGSSCDEENCNDCKKTGKLDTNGTDSDDVVIIENDASSSDSVVLVSITAAPVSA